MPQRLRAMTAWWARQLSQRQMPWLLYKDHPVQHWQGKGGQYLGAARGECVRPSKDDAADLNRAHLQTFKEAVAGAGMPRGAFAVLPIFWPSLERNDEHPALSSYNDDIVEKQLEELRRGILPQQ